MTVVGSRPGVWPTAARKERSTLEADLAQLRTKLVRLRDTLRGDIIANGGTPAPTGADDAAQ